MASTKPTTKADPCSICGNTNGHCKRGTEHDSLVFCHNHEFRQGLEIAGHKAIKQSSEWCVFTSISSTNPQQSTQSKQPSKKPKLMTAEQRDKAFRGYISDKVLHPDDRADLYRRGLDDRQIEAWGVVSIDGNNPGYICPCYTPDSLIVGAQWRLRDARDGARYKWVSWLADGTHFNGELPLTCHRPTDRTPTGIAIVEGIGAKSFILAQRSGMVTIGAGAAAQFSASLSHWKNYLSALSAELGTKTIHFYPDSGAVQNMSVIRHYHTFFAAAIGWGYEIKVAWWGQIEKGQVPDVDELDSLEVIKLIELEEFEEIAKAELGEENALCPDSIKGKALPETEVEHPVIKALAAVDRKLAKWEWAVLTEPDQTQANKAIKAGLELEELGAKRAETIAFKLTEEVFKKVPELLDCIGLEGHYWWEYLGNKRKQAHDTLRLYEVFGKKLRFNALTLEVELEGVENPVEGIKHRMETQYKITLRSAKDDVLETMQVIAKQNSYHPVRDYLKNSQIATTERITPAIILQRALGVEPNHPTFALYEKYLSCFFIGAVARAFEPGCQFRSVLTLRGGQYIGKSEFFKALANGWFDDSIQLKSDKDDRLKMARAWICEWAELEYITGRKESGAVKSFISSSVDYVRPPYGRSVLEYKRTSVLVATVNEGTFLKDSTGSTRYHVIDLGDKLINQEWLAQSRDAIWAWAVEQYQSGARYWFDPVEDRGLLKTQATDNEQFEEEDPWLSTISAYLQIDNHHLIKDGNLYIEPKTILNDCLKVELVRQTTKEARRVRDCLKKLGYVSNKDPIHFPGIGSIRVWSKSIATAEEPSSEPTSTNHQKLPTGDWETELTEQEHAEVENCVQLVESVKDGDRKAVEVVAGALRAALTSQRLQNATLARLSPELRQKFDRFVSPPVSA